MKLLQSLPIGIQHFDVLRERGDIYIDKTRQIHELMNAGVFLFLARPRRFGKSLLISTLREIFRGNRALFEGLWIEDQIDWQPRPVILLNFNDINYQSMSLSDALTDYMDDIAADYQITLTERDYKGKFRELIVALSTQGKIALLVDEYDKPITDMLDNPEKVEEHITVLKNLYSVLKSTESAHIHFALLTGVSKYGKISIFSDLNNLKDLTVDERTATLLGITQHELESYFGAYIERLCDRHNMTRDAMLTEIERWYNGYSWDGIHRVYVPFSTLLFLDQQIFANHWFSTATPTFLIKLLREKQIPAYDLENVSGDNTLLDSANVTDINILSLLFQTGYLTIKSSHHSRMGQRYQLGYPNFEVSQSFQESLLADYIDQPVDQLLNSVLSRLEEMLANQDVDGFITVLRAVFADIPHQLHLPYEAYYHSVVYLILRLLGFNVNAERPNNLGRMDALLELPNAIYIIEFKIMDEEQSNSESMANLALQQIKEKGYDTPFRGTEKKIILLGIVFGKQNRNIVDWKQNQ